MATITSVSTRAVFAHVRLRERAVAGRSAALEAREELDRLVLRLLDVWLELRRGDGPAAGRRCRPAAGDDARLARLRQLAVESTRAAGCGESAEPETRPRQRHTPAPVPSRHALPDPGIEDFARVAAEVRATYVRLSASLAGSASGGITVVDPRTVETDRYRIQFESGHVVRITDLSTGQYTRVWGDPHVDLSTVSGTLDGEFSDLTESADVTTFVLRDGTRVRFQAPDRGLVERIDVVSGSARVSGIGMDEGKFNVGLFHEVGAAVDVASDAGDVVVAGDDGATWYDRSGRLVWGAATTSPSGTPAAPVSDDRS